MAHPRSEEFARELDAFLNSVLPSGFELTVVDTHDGIRVGPAPFDSGQFSLVRLCPDSVGPLLKIEYSLADDISGRFCRVLSSTFGLFVPVANSDRGAKAAPVIRVEYEQSQDPPAHVHFHTSSAPLGWVYGVVGGNYRRSEALHFPVGSKRFRPTIEDFLMFLDRERIFRNWRSRQTFIESLRARQADYERRQAVSTVRHYAEDIAEEMRSLGWTVEAP